MGEKVLITGASSGIGRATASAFAEQGGELFLVARRGNLLKEVADHCLGLGSPRAEVAEHDLSRPGEGAVVVRRMLEVMAGLDVLVCNAGYGFLGPVWEMDAAAMARMWQVNFQSGYESIQEALPHFRERRRGHIVLVSSIIGRKAMPFNAAYCATKFAQVGLGESLWGELRDEGIGVSVVCPGYTATEFHGVASSERRRRRPIQGQSAETVARILVKAVRKRRRLVHLTFLGRFFLAMDRLSPSLAAWAAYLAARRDLVRASQGQGRTGG